MGPRIPHVVLALALTLTLALTVASCSNEPEPKFADPTTTPGTPTTPGTSSTSSTPTAEPTTNDPPKNETPEEFIRRFQRAAFDMQNSGESASFREMTSNCLSCDDFADRVDKIYEDGGQIAIAQNSTKKIRVLTTVDSVTVMEYELHATPTVISDRSGAVVERYPGGVDRFQLNIRRRSGHWLVLRLNRLVKQ